MEKTIDLRPGQVYTNEDLMNTFKCSGQGGMRRAKRTNSLVIVSNHVKSIYDDRWEGDILYYTGMGAEGDQSFYSAQNKTLYELPFNGVSVHLFEVFIPREYTYIGEVVLADKIKPFYEKQKDSLGNLRDVCIFPLKMAGDETPFLEKKDLDKNREAKKKQIKKLDYSTLSQLAKRGSRTPGTRNVYTIQYERNQAVAELAKCIAKGICQLCRKEAPFKDKFETPFLETHHIEWLSEGGSDTIDNTVALCPNCHAKMHILDKKEDREYLKKVVQQLIMESNL